MIPHHQNAVNMAKSLLKRNALECDDIRDQGNPDCVMLKILYNIINAQNHQIHEMTHYLNSIGKLAKDDCAVNISMKLSTGTRRRRTQALPSDSTVGRMKDMLADVSDVAAQASASVTRLLL
jgi:uncharacterized protein (DUF305 family)